VGDCFKEVSLNLSMDDEERESNKQLHREAMTARSYRRRRKIYVELLENKVTELC